MKRKTTTRRQSEQARDNGKKGGRPLGAKDKFKSEVEQSYRDSFIRTWGVDPKDAKVRPTQERALDNLNRMLLRLAANGDSRALIHVAERVLGKIAIPVEHTGGDEPLKHVVYKAQLSDGQWALE